MGLLSLHAEQSDHAVEWFSRAIRIDAKPRYLVSLGHALKRQGRLEEAVRVFNKAVELDLDSAEAWKSLAQILADFKRQDEAIRAFQHVFKLDSTDADAAFQAGVLLIQSGRPDEALVCFEQSDRVRPDHVPTLQMRAIALNQLSRFEAAVTELARAHALDPSDAEICNNLGVLLRRDGRPEEALIWLDKALSLRPDYSAASNNKVSALVDLNRCDEALAICLKVMAADPENAEAEYNVGFLQLLKGNFEAGWAPREARWRMPPGQAPTKYNFPQPLWLGKEPIAGKTILIHQEEGLGDTIQFVRYVPMLAALGARVILLVQDALVPLLSGVEGVSQCVPKSAEVYVSFDLYCPITTLPLAFGTRMETIPSCIPYLPAPDAQRVQAWEQRLGPHNKMRVGLVWSGNPRQPNDNNRSTNLRTLLPLLDLDAMFVSLQKDPRPDDRALLAETNIVDLTAHLIDFAETAALLSCLDLVISVCTSTAHLAGALARPTWIMLCHAPDFRWLLDRDDSPWYPTARLFRQTKVRDYTGVVARMRTELAAHVATWSAATGERADAPRSDVAAWMHEAGRALMRVGNHVDAERCCREALAQNPDHAGALHLMGLLSLEHRHYDQAVEWLSRAIRNDPQPLYLGSLGTTLLTQGLSEEALQVFDKAVQLKPDDADLWRNLGDVLVELDRPQDAIPSYQHALKLDPRHLDAARKAGLLLHQAARDEEALSCFNLSEELEADHLPTLRLRALTLARLQRFEEALADNSRAHTLDPGADTCENTGNVLRALSRHDEAIAWYDRALALAAGLRGDARQQGGDACRAAPLRRGDRDQPPGDRGRSGLRRGEVESGARPSIDREFRGRLGRARGALEDSSLLALLSEAVPADVARRRAGRGQDRPGMRGRGIGRQHPVRALRPDAGRARRTRYPGRAGCAVFSACRHRRRRAMPAEIRSRAAGLRFPLPDVEPAARLRHKARELFPPRPPICARRRNA